MGRRVAYLLAMTAVAAGAGILLWVRYGGLREPAGWQRRPSRVSPGWDSLSARDRCADVPPGGWQCQRFGMARRVQLDGGAPPIDGLSHEQRALASVQVQGDTQLVATLSKSVEYCRQLMQAAK